MTYGQLLANLQELTPTQLQDNVTIRMNDDEWYLVNGFYINDVDDVIDAGHAYLDIPE